MGCVGCVGGICCGSWWCGNGVGRVGVLVKGFGPLGFTVFDPQLVGW